MGSLRFNQVENSHLRAIVSGAHVLVERFTVNGREIDCRVAALGVS